MQHPEIVSEPIPGDESLPRAGDRARAGSRHAMRRALEVPDGGLAGAGDQPTLQTPTVLAGCRASWHEALCREARAVLGASVYAFDQPLALVCAACEILARGDEIDLVILEGDQERALGFLRDVAPALPVVLVGRRDDLQARIRAATGGAAAFLAEPVTVREIARVGRAFVGTDAPRAMAGEIPIPLHLIGRASQ